MASNQDDGKDGKDVAAHGDRPDVDQPGRPDGSKPRYPKLDDEDDTEGHLYGAGPSTQGEVFPHPGDNPHGDR